MEKPNIKPRSPEIEAAISLSRALETSLRTTIDAKKETSQAEYQATHDPLTGAFNRRGLKEYIEKAEAPKAMLLVDVTNFKSINDTYGYRIGDEVICGTYEVLINCIRPNDVVGRWGGDEFVVVLGAEGEAPYPEKLTEERRFERAREEHINPIKKRIGEGMRKLLDERPLLNELNLDLAVGGAVWPGSSSIEGIIDEAESEMKIHKAQQHRNDRNQVA